MRKPSGTSRDAIYLRCSSDDQRHGDFTTIDAQEALCRRFSAETGGEVTKVYKDEGKTGTNLKRSGFRSLHTDANAKLFDRVIVRDMSRLARGDMFAVAEHLLKEAKVRVATVLQQFTDNAAGKMSKSATAFGDGIYPLMVSDWTRAKQAEMVTKGYYTGGMVSFGYRSETVPGMTDTHLPGGKVKPAPKRLVPDPDAAPVVVGAFETMVDTDNLGAVQRFLREQVPTRKWSMDLVRRLLTNPRYRGVNRSGDTVNENAHEAIIPLALWNAVQALFAERAERPSPSGGEGRELGYQNIEDRVDAFTYYLRGKVFCDSCDCRMTTFWAKGASTPVSYYQCVRCGKRGYETCPVKRVNAKTLHAAVVAEIVWIASHETRLEGLIREATARLPKPTELKAEVAKIAKGEREKERALRSVVATIEAAKGQGLSTLAARVGELESELESLRARRRDLESRAGMAEAERPSVAIVSKVWQSFGKVWEVLSETERAELLPLIVEEVRFTGKNEGTLQLILQGASVKDIKPSLFSETSLRRVRNFALDGCG